MADPTVQLRRGESALFAYGALMLRDRLAQSIGRAHAADGIPCTLAGWQRVWDLAAPNGWDVEKKDRGIAAEHDGERFVPHRLLTLNIRKHADSSVAGLLWVLDDSELAMLDGQHPAFQRIPIREQLAQIAISGGEAYAYVGRREHHWSDSLAHRFRRSPHHVAVLESYAATVGRAAAALPAAATAGGAATIPEPPRDLIVRDVGPTACVELSRVLEAEVDYLHHHRHSDQPDRALVQRSLVGLALSGGGIRSATTNLGILQALATMRILPMVDYLSTVSGGGYIGACLSSLLSWNETAETRTTDLRAPFTFDAAVPPAFSTHCAGFPFLPYRSAKDASPKPGQPSPAASPAPAASTVAPSQRVASRAGSGIVAHLRTHGNFLIAHRGLFRRDALRGIGALTIGMVYNAGAFLVTLFAVSALYVGAMMALVPDLPALLSWAPDTTSAVPAPTAVTDSAAARAAAAARDTARTSLVAGDSSLVRTRQDTVSCPAGDTTCVVAAATPMHAPAIADVVGRNARTVGLVFHTGLRDWFDGPGSLASRLRDVPAPLGPILYALLLGVIAAVGVLMWMRRRLRAYVEGDVPDRELPPGDSEEEAFERDVLQQATVAVLVVTGVAIAVAQVQWRGALDGANQLVSLFVPFATLVGALLVAFFAVTVVLPGRPEWTRRSRSLSSAFYAIMSWGFYIMLAVGIAPLAIFAMRDHPTGVGIGAIGSLVITRFLAGRDPGSGKRFSLSPGMLRLVLGAFVLLLLVLGTLFFAALVARHFGTPRAAFIAGGISAIVLIALGRLADHNKLGPQFFYRDRLSETYLFSELPDKDARLRVFRDAMEMPLDVLHGREARPGSGWRNPAPYHLLSAAINLAGSRDLTRKDRKSGYWLFSKLYCGSTHTGFRPTAIYRRGRTKLATAVSISGAAASSGIGRDTFFAQAFATVLFNIRLGSWLENPAMDSSVKDTERRIFWPRYLIREVGMNTTESKRLVNLSDGGHTGDNIGIYPLLQRRCKVIIACDAERDPRLSFGSFTEALRHAYVDLGIDVDIDLTMLRADPATGLSRSHCAVGRIHYPDRPDQESFLIYLKNSLIGSEPEPVLNYKVTCPDFPHETTVDQFFDDAQFESYRALGVHIAEHAFGSWASDATFKDALRHHAPDALAHV